MSSLVDQHDCLLLDLDGTVFRGHEPTPGAVETLDAIEARTLYVTNNASRDAGEVAAHLRELGFVAQQDDVVTSAQSAARLLADQLPPGAKVLIVGTDALAGEVGNVGLTPVRRFADEPAAVVQGHSTATGWSDLAEAALAIRSGALWVAANIDKTLPSERGLLPGNGSMVAALQAATEQDPQVAGKPSPVLIEDALARGDFQSPLVVGDRLDTDIAGANAAELPSLMVLCGVNTAADAIWAVPQQRPDCIAEDLRGLTAASDALRVAPQPGWQTDIDSGVLTVLSRHSDTGNGQGHDPGDGLAVVRAIAAAVWAADGQQRPTTLAAGDDAARQAMQRWSLVPVAIG